MTDRLKGVVVTFTHDLREDDAEAIMSAIRMIKGVATVAPRVATFDDDMNQARVRRELEQQLFDVLHGPRQKR